MRVACLLLSCAVALSRAGVVVDNGLPILWNHATALLSDIEVNAEGVYVPNAWHYLQRMSFYRLIIASTDIYMTSMGSEANQSPLWGLPLQLGWMLTSGRLADPTKTTQCGVQTGDEPNMCISPSSWWSCVNYFTSALPFLSAAKNGILGAGVTVLLASSDGTEGYCTTYDTCLASYPQAMNNWDTFFTNLKESIVSTLPDNEKKDLLLGLYWDAVLASTHASAVCNDKRVPPFYSTEEKEFSDNWLNSGEYVAAAYFQSNLELATKFMTPLPGRMLKNGDIPMSIEDLTTEENRTLYIFSWMQSIQNVLPTSLISLWRNSMCSLARRETGRGMLQELMLNGNYGNFVNLVTTMSSSCE